MRVHRMQVVRLASPMLLLFLLFSVGCSRGFYGWRPDQVEVKVNGDPFEEYIKVRDFAIQMTEAYDSRAGANRGALYAGSTTLLGLTAASSGLAAFGAAATGAGKSLPIVSTFINGLFGIFDNRQLANLYTTAANKLRKAVADSDAAFLAEPVEREKWTKVSALQARVLDVISELEEGRNAATPDPGKAVQRTIATKNEVEEALSIRPKITALIPPVLPLAGGPVQVKGSGFDAKSEVLLDGFLQPMQFISESELRFGVPAPTDSSLKVVERSIVIRNRYGREVGSPTTLVQADLSLATTPCTIGKRTVDPKDPAVLYIEGTGFQPDGSLSVKVKEPVKVLGKIWRSHTQWELRFDNSNPDAAITIDELKVTNPRPQGSEKTLPAGQRGQCDAVVAPAKR